MNTVTLRAPVLVSVLAVVLSASTRSPGERRIWLPVALILLLCSLGVALDIGEAAAAGRLPPRIGRLA